MRLLPVLPLSALYLASLTLLGARTARADDSPTGHGRLTDTEPGSTVTPTTSVWYGYETLATDGAALGLGLGGVAAAGSSGGNYLGTAAVVTFALGGPIVHLAHGKVGKAFGDLGLRVGTPLVLGFIGAVIGAAATPAPRSGEALQSAGNLLDGVGEGAAIGLLAGAVTASAIDAIFLAREERSVVLPPRAAAAHVAPAVSVGREPNGGRATVGITGTF